MRPAGEHLRAGRCPSCEKKTLWTWVEKSGSVQCDRGSCGFISPTKELYPDLFANISKTYQATPEEPNRTADAYLSIIRGFNLEAIKGWYEQGKYWNPNGDRGTETVKFYLDAEKTLYWQRFINEVTITDESGDKKVEKCRFNKSLAGLWWQPPNLSINNGDTIYLTEGIFDAISLAVNGFKAVSIMSSGTFPHESIKAHLGKKVNWVLALDNDEAGRKASRKHALELKKLHESVTCALTSESVDKLDWNDLHIRHKINPAYMEDYLYFGALEFAGSANDKAFTMWKRNKLKCYFVFRFSNCTYRFKIDEEDYKKSYSKAYDGCSNVDQAEEEAFSQTREIIEIANFGMEYLYSQQPANGDDGWYFIKITYNNGKKPYQCAVSGDAFSEAKKFKKTMQVKAHGALFAGSNADMDFMYKQWFSTQQKSVRTLDFVGYDEDTKAYVFPEFAVENGKILKLNSDAFFALKDTGIKTDTDIKQRLTDKPPVAFIDDYITAFGHNGIIGMAWWLGTLVCEQIRSRHSSYPYLQVIGEGDSGKSAMVHFLWKLLGKNGDSFNPNSSSLAGRFRKMAEVSCLPIVFNEVDNENENQKPIHVKKFLWDEHKDLFEGELGRVTGVKSHDNTTRKPTFKSALMAVQNVRVQASTAMQSRFVHLLFDRSHHSLAGKKAADRLRDMEITDVSGFLLQVCSNSDKLLKEYCCLFPHYQRELAKNPAIKMQRIIQNHAQLMALTECLKMFVAISDAEVSAVQEKLKRCAENWQRSMGEDHPTVQQFWFTFEYLNSRLIGNSIESDVLNHSNNPDSEIAINLEFFNSKCIEEKQETIPTKELRELLMTSRAKKYLRTAPVHSRILRRTVRCMIFKAQ